MAKRKTRNYLAEAALIAEGSSTVLPNMKHIIALTDRCNVLWAAYSEQQVLIEQATAVLKRLCPNVPDRR